MHGCLAVTSLLQKSMLVAIIVVASIESRDVEAAVVSTICRLS